MPRNRMFLKDVRSVGLVDRGACGGDVGKGGADITLFKRAGEVHMSEKTETVDKVDSTDPAELEAAQKRIAELEAENETLKANAEKSAESTDEPTEDDVLKNADPAVVELIEKQRKATEDAQKRADEAVKLAEAETEKRETREWVEKASAYKALPVKADDLGPVLRKASAALSDDEFGTLSTALKAGDEAIAKGFEELGKSNASDDESAKAEVQKRAVELVKSGDAPTIEQARVKVRQSDRDLAERERNEA